MKQALTFVVLNADGDSAKELNFLLAAGSRTRLLADCHDADQFYSDVMRLQPAAVIINLGDNPERAFALIKRLSATSPDVAIISAAQNASTSLILNSLRAGAREFLQLPVNESEFKTVLDRTEEFCAERSSAPQKKKGRVVAVFSTKGGCGVSFIAANLAASMERPTLLADFNLQAGDLDSLLGIEPRHTIADVVKNRQRLDEALIGSYVTTHSPNLSLLSAPLEAHEAEDIKPEHIFEVLHVLRERYACIVLDLQHTLDPITVTALDQADDVLLVFTLDIPGIRSTKRALKVFERIGYPREKIHVVVNRWSKHIDVELKKVEHHLGERIVGFIPNDYRKVIDSINLGQPLVRTDPSSRIAAEIRRLATMFSDKSAPPTEQPRRGLLRSMFSRQAAPTRAELRAMLDKA